MGMIIDDLDRRITAIENWQKLYDCRNKGFANIADSKRVNELEAKIKELEDWQVAWYLGKHQEEYSDKAWVKLKELEKRVDNVDCCAGLRCTCKCGLPK